MAHEQFPPIRGQSAGGRVWNAMDIDVYHPFYLHLSDHPSLKLVSLVLTGVANYQPWCRGVKVALYLKNKVGFIHGSIVIPSENDPKYTIWKQVNNTIISWLTHCVSETIAQSIIYSETALSVCKDLEGRFAQPDHFRLSDLVGDLHTIKQGAQSGTEYYTKMKILLDEYSMLRLIPMCVETGDQYKVKMSCIDHLNADHVICFLKGLNDQFVHVRSQILLMQPLPPFSVVFNMVVQQENQLSVATKHPKPEASAFGNQVVNHAGGRYGYRGRGFNGSARPKCTHYGFDGHTIENCYKIHGYPPGFTPRNKRMNSARIGSNNSVLSGERNSAAAGHIILTDDQYNYLMKAMSKDQHSSATITQVNAFTGGTGSQTHMTGPENEEEDWFC